MQSNTPISKIVKTNIGNKFFNLTKRNFPKHLKIWKIFNKDTIKLSYSCFRNMSSVIASYNRRIIQPTSNNHGCNDRQTFYIDQSYQHPVNEITDISVLQKLHLNYTADCRRKRYVISIELSKYVWKLKDEKITANIKWIGMSIVYGTPKGGVCKLCLCDKFWLLKYFVNEHLLNEKLKFISKCRYENKLLVKSAGNRS